MNLFMLLNLYLCFIVVFLLRVKNLCVHAPCFVFILHLLAYVLLVEIFPAFKPYESVNNFDKPSAISGGEISVTTRCHGAADKILILL